MRELRLGVFVADVRGALLAGERGGPDRLLALRLRKLSPSMDFLPLFSSCPASTGRVGGGGDFGGAPEIDGLRDAKKGMPEGVLRGLSRLERERLPGLVVLTVGVRLLAVRDVLLLLVLEVLIRFFVCRLGLLLLVVGNFSVLASDDLTEGVEWEETSTRFCICSD